MRRLGPALFGAILLLIGGASGSAGRSGGARAQAAASGTEFVLLPGTDQSKRHNFTFEAGVTYHMEISGTVTRQIQGSPSQTYVYDAFCTSANGGPFQANNNSSIQVGVPGEVAGGPIPVDDPGDSPPPCNAQHHYSFNVSPTFWNGKKATRFFWAQPFGYQDPNSTWSGSFDIKIAPAPKWKSGFRFTQRGYPDGHHTIRTQTGGAGSIIWPDDPELGSERGTAAHGSSLFSIDEIPSGNLNLSIGIHYGYFASGSTYRLLELAGVITKSNDPHCTVGKHATVRLTEGIETGVPSKIEISVKGCREETWTSVNPHRVSVYIEVPHAIT